MRGDPPHNQFQHGRASAIILCTEFDVKAQHCMAELAKASRQASTAAKDFNNNLIPVGNGTFSRMAKRTPQSRHAGFISHLLRSDLTVDHGIQFVLEAADLANSV